MENGLAERPWWRDPRTALLLLVTLLTLTLGWLHKARCHERPWDGYQWNEFCYSDVQALYATRGAADGTWPYLETFNEYPPVTGIFMHVVGELTPSRDAYLVLSGVLLGLLALAVTVLLGELVGRDRRVLYWALAPALALYFTYNWDMLAIAPAVGALLAFRKGHMGLAGALLGLGASAKLFPAFLAPALGLWILREERGLRRRGWAFGLGFAAVWLAIHAPFFAQNLALTWEAYSFQAERGANFESLWYALAHLGRAYGVGGLDLLDDDGIVDWLALVPLLAALAFSGWAAWTRRLDPVVAACIPVFAFLAVNKVFSVQYTLWAIPLLVVLHAPRLLKALVVVADLVVFFALFGFFATMDRGGAFTPVALFVIFRAGVFAAVVVHLVRQAFPPASPVLVGAPGASPAVAAPRGGGPERDPPTGPTGRAARARSAKTPSTTKAGMSQM